MEPRIILASASPRRRQLLTDAGYSFEVDPPDENVESSDGLKLSPEELVAYLAFQKARHIAAKHSTGMVVAADTVAECNGEILGKPGDREHAGHMLRAMRGTVHFVHTGICVWRRPDDRKSVRTATTTLRMSALDDSQIESYLDSGLWQGKAGAFGYQDDLEWVQIIEGDADNVVGLPMQLLANMLNGPVFRPAT